MIGITFNRMHSYRDFDLTITRNGRTIGMPSKKKITHEIPYMSGSYDFSTLYGTQAYTERSLTYVFQFEQATAEAREFHRIEVLIWLQSQTRTQLRDDSIPGFFFIAECVSSSWNDDGFIGILTVNFDAYPFKMSDEIEGSDIWDVFNFNLDFAQVASYDVFGKLAVMVMNVGLTRVTPTIVADSNFTVTRGNVTIDVVPGTSQNWRLSFYPGENSLKIVGTGHIGFEFHKEVI